MEADDFGGGASPRAFVRTSACFAFQFLYARLAAELNFVEGGVGQGLCFLASQFADSFVETGHGDAVVRVVEAGREPGGHQRRVGHRAAPYAAVEVRLGRPDGYVEGNQPSGADSGEGRSGASMLLSETTMTSAANRSLSFSSNSSR